MPVISRSREVPASPQRLWTVVADPEHLPRWWPRVARVEEATREAWTTVMASPKGRPVRADYTLLDSDHPNRLRWRQELEESPFERILSSAITQLEMEPRGESASLVRLTADMRLRGFSRFGGLQVTRATRRQLDGALDGLEELARGFES